MIGPSAPNGPLVPIAIAVDNGFSTATFGSMRLRPMRIASIASGRPWPRIFSEPYRACLILAPARAISLQPSQVETDGALGITGGSRGTGSAALPHQLARALHN